MIIWIDAQLSPALAPWIKKQFAVDAIPVKDVGLCDATDHDIFMAAKQKSAVVMTKDNDFLQLLDKFGSPPQVIWVTLGNTFNARLKQVLKKIFPKAPKHLDLGEPLVEISDAW